MTTPLLDTAALPAAAPPPAPSRGRVRRIGRRALTAVGTIVLTAILGVFAATIAIPALLGATPLTVLTSSMDPTYPPGTLVIVQPTPPQDFAVGDVLTYQLHSGRPEVVTHRIVEVALDSSGEHVFRTQGDNNPHPDPQTVREAQVKGKVVYAVPVLGYVQNALSGHTRDILVPAIATGLFLYAAVTITRIIVERRRGRNA